MLPPRCLHRFDAINSMLPRCFDQASSRKRLSAAAIIDWA